MCSLFLQGSTPLTNQVCFKDQCVNVEVAYKTEDIMRGLMDRPSLPERNGMLFVFYEPRRQSFWMKDTLISLDIIWLDTERSVTTILANTPPCKAEPCPTYGPDKASLYVLEINANEAQKLGIRPGDKAEFRLDAFMKDNQ